MRVLPDILAAETTGLSECFDRLAAHKRDSRPLSTYRLQFNKDFRFTDARALVGYLHEFGISHVYSSPILKARPGSMHGYDISDHNVLNPEIGSEEDLRAFVEELKDFGMGQILDVVPNHMGVGQGDNPWWQDILENGQTAKHADFFDIDWDPLKTELRDKVLLPILANQYGEELEAGHIRLAFNYEHGRFQVGYYDNVLPVDPQTIPMIFDPSLRSGSTNGGSVLGPFKQLLEELQSLPHNTERRAELAKQRRQAAPGLLNRLAVMMARSPEIRQLVEQALARINGKPGHAQSFDALHRLLEAQAYRLAHWRVSAEEINYRRFFDINDLVGLCMENPKVFAATHKLLRRLLAEGSVSGIRIDHCDGLLNPRQHLVRVQMLYAASQCCGPVPVPPLAENGIEAAVQSAFGQHDWMNQQAPLYAVVEKILEPGEEFPAEWPVDGTSGYDFVNLVNGIFIQSENRQAFTTIYERFIGERLDFDSLLYNSKKLIMNTALSSEVNVLTHVLDVISGRDRRARDFTRKALRDAIRETIACFPVYRTYIDERGEVNERDAAYINKAIASAKRRNAGTAAAVFDFLRDNLLLKNTNRGGADAEYGLKLHFTLKFQQLTGPVMAKGLEDTVCYVYNRFISVNEVGGSPKLFGHPVEEFHRGNLIRAERWPFSMLATSTHDTKRSEDVRARLNVLSEMPKLWSTQVGRWHRQNQAKKVTLPDGRQAPDANEEYLLYQTLVGSWPLEMSTEVDRERYIERITQYMVKAMHEAKINLSWINPDPEYVEAVSKFVRQILTPGAAGKNSFLRNLGEFLPAVQFFGAINSLSQTLLKITSPGVPDIYQGTEMWDFSLVDPDNRRPVDFNLRREALSGVKERIEQDLPAMAQELLQSYQDGRVKLFTTWRAMEFRSRHPELFRASSYLPLEVTGEKRDHICAFAREYQDPLDGQNNVAIVVVPRFAYTLTKGRITAPLGEVWGDTEIHVTANTPHLLENVFSGETAGVSNRRTLLCQELFRVFPMALLSGR